MRISIPVCTLENYDMHTTDYRRRNLVRAIKERGISQAELARKLEIPAPNINQLIKGPRPFGHEMARKIEGLLEYRYGWMDEEVPLTDEAIGIARSFQCLKDEHRTKVSELVAACVAVEQHEEEVRRLMLGAAEQAK